MACQSNGITSSGIKFRINLVRNPNDLEDETSYFPPTIMPAVIEDFSGEIMNTKPDIRLSFWSSSLKTIITTNVNDNKLNTIIVQDLNNDLSLNNCNERNNFLALYDEEFKFKPYGKLIHTFERQVLNKIRHFEIYFTEFEENDSFKELHHRMETFTLLFIDGARRITVDPRWCCFCLYEIEKSPKLRYHFIGYSTVYRFCLITDKVRPRISQFFIAPPFQRCGLGKYLLRVEQNYIINTMKVLEITVEEPCDAFLEMRDIVDAERILTAHPSFIPQILDTHPSSKKTVTADLQKRLFIPNKRVGHMYEIVKLYCIRKKAPVQIEAFKREVEVRLTVQRMNEMNVSQRQRHHGLRCSQSTTQDHSILTAQIEKEFQILFNKYESIIEKLIKSEPEWINKKQLEHEEIP